MVTQGHLKFPTRRSARDGAMRPARPWRIARRSPKPGRPVGGDGGVHSARVFVLPPRDGDAVDDRGVELNALDMFFFGSQPYAREEFRNEEGDLSSSHLVEEIRGREVLHR